VGVFRSVDRPTYDDVVRSQVSATQEKAGGPASDDDLAALLAGSDTWRVG
jgi:2-oxoglutarate/2-oxoacid ferredoxin oxidoreductase subunit beta